MEYEAFVETLRQKLSAESGIYSEKVRFQEKGKRFAEAGDRLLIELAEHEGSKEICALYTEELFGFYQAGAAVEELVQEILRDIEEAKTSRKFHRAKEMTDYEKIRGDLFIRLVNEELHREELKDAVYKTIGDIALVVYAEISESDEGITSMRIPKSLAAIWKKNKEELFKEALLNTYFISPPRIYRWEELLYDPNYAGENFMDLVSGRPNLSSSFGNCLSTSKKINGAVAVFLPGVAERLYDLMNSDFYIVFTSIHEAMIHDATSAYEEDLKEALDNVNKEITQKEDFLSSYVYRYNHETRRFSCISQSMTGNPS